MASIYVLNENKRKKLDNHNILLDQPTLITGRGIKSSAIFVQSTQKQHEARDERRGKNKCHRQCLETRNFNLHTADEKVAVHGEEIRSAVVIKHTFYNVAAMEGAGLVVFLPHYSSLSKHKPAIQPLPRLAAE